ncbi:putative phosphatidate phosphatase [Drosophila grimshawi]|uniref:GH16692 n=1 Tax=Drosophila grimshawi TaxID=7222 RepID=B4J310_DROGR|nr:putative phosphatidate phosphatase [Drosophila grimshawi]EDV97180.1 GH16692 [Drosophila grimshawi]
MSKYTKLARGICDVLLWGALTAASLLLNRLVKPFKRGFFCGDESLGYPFRESTIGTALVIGITLAVPTAVIIVVELFKQLPLPGGREKRETGCRLSHRLGQVYRQAGYYLFGLAMLTFATLLTKLCIGRLRPHFYAVCQPMLSDGTDCEAPQNVGRYIDGYVCSNANMTDFQYEQLNQSFPSGHASMMMYAMLYLAIYLQAALSTRISKLLKHLLQFLFVMFGWYVSLTRITDYWHHWSDVLAGIIFGVIFAWLTSVYVADLFAFKRCNRTGYSANTLMKKPQVSPKSSTKSQSNAAAAAAAAAAVVAANNGLQPALPAYTFGTLPYLPAHPAQAQYAQTYHNYGYVP